ncbi:Gfo/Idh/MocA family protein [Deinococcus maricopensis]|uniref:Oxidoreductase domain protein n=1 Tax=Deinococcus maricopensis (strain DSM 21211 / LMG 22137 / NRRL B-23946 / LB-34) TaxID=709986 RepID=E8U8W7_DEIML|nr:Gfo/Idh/MocA family oxidoreductase [Deinococcus maricopensis]ADV67506.1 oxidoreductase domain protein [Deinococcus maricopensis DSM 21211]
MTPAPSVAVLGCGNRGGDVYARHLTAQGARVTHLVDARPARLAEVAVRGGVPPERTFTDAAAFFALGRVADAVVIATPDDGHVEPCLEALRLGYHVLLEKPICLNEAELDLLLAAECASSGTVTVCHVLRASPFFRAVRAVLDRGVLGRLVGVTHAENVAYWHFAHSFVRGNWRASPPAAPFILAKACHDLDLLRWFVGAPPAQVSSVAGRHHFRAEDAPAGASDRCVTCPVVACPYDARRIYGARAPGVWPVTVLTAGGVTLEEALEAGPYGRCVYACDNDVPDHQATLITFRNGVQATLTVSAFTHENTRTLRLLGTHGELRGHLDRGELEVHDFRTGAVEVQRVDASGNHGGGDEGLVAAWLAFLRGDAPGTPTPLAESLDSHRLAFAAERARRAGTVEAL